MSHVAAIHAYSEGFEPCARHPSRRARGWCEACGRSWCRDCIFPSHDCPAKPPSPLTRVRPGAVVLALLLALAAILLCLVRLPAPSSPRTPAPIPVRAVEAAPSSQPEAPAALPADSDRPQTAALATGPVAASSAAASGADPKSTQAASPTRLPAIAASAISLDRGSKQQPAVMLTFDAGSGADGAREILDVLAAHGLRTTFFVTGEFVRGHPDLARRLLRDGHEVGNHTDSHPHLTMWVEESRHRTRPEVSRSWLLAEIEATDRAFREATGRPMARLWRAPYGEVNREILSWAAEAGWQHVGWTRTLDSLDWVADPDSSLYRAPEEIARRLLDFPERDDHGARGGIMLMHLGSERPPEQRLDRVLPAILEGFRQRGLRFVTASAMLQDS